MDVLHGIGGHRLAWSGVPAGLRAGIAGLLGAPVVAAATQPGGFSPGVAARLTLADGRRAFVKAVDGADQPISGELLRKEAVVLAGLAGVALPAGVGVSELLGVREDGDWLALVLADIDGRPPAIPWRPAELDRVFGAVHALGAALTPAPVPAPSAADSLGPALASWARVARHAELAARLPAWAREHLDLLVALESRWPAASVGDTLLQCDLRADNILLTADRVMVVDWPHACVGAAWVDPLFMMPSLIMQGVAEPAAVWARHPAAAAADPDDVNAALAALTGYFVRSGLRPPPRGLPTIRQFQSAQGETGLAWLRARLDG